MEKNQKYRNFPIKKKLLISHGTIIVFSVVLCIVLLVGAQRIKSRLDGLYEGPLQNIDAIGDVRFALTDVQRAMDRMLGETETDLNEAYAIMEEDIEEDVAILLSATDLLEKNLLTEESRAELQELLAKVDEGEQLRPEAMELLKKGDFDKAYDVCFNQYLPIVDEIKEISAALETDIRSVASSYYTASDAVSKILIIVGILMMVAVTMLAMYITVRMAKAISIPIEEIRVVSEQMHQGDLSGGALLTYESEDEIGIVEESLRGTMRTLGDYVEEISANLREIATGDLTKNSEEITDFRGDFSSIKESFVYILKRFNSTLTDIQNASDRVTTSSGQIANSSRSLSEGATDQASAIEELTATVETVAGLADESAKNTQEAYENIGVSAKKAENEMRKMEELTEEMHRITEISKEIENIITAIEDIASQTNLLSLNASIEAARAGEAGRGFAVVADQIGKLASDSAQSAVNTRELIGKTLEEIEKGNAITASTSVAFKNVISDMKAFATVAQQINETAKNQALALEQVERGIDQISAVMQNTAMSSEQSASISEELSQEAGDLDTLVRRFRLY